MIPLIILFLSVVMSGCGTETEAKSNLHIAKDVAFGKQDYETIMTPNNDLGFKILTEVDADDNDNRFISPTSLMMALGMVYNGADGETKDEIAETLQAEGIDIEDMNQANASLMTMLDRDMSDIQLDVANSIWLADGFHFNDDFSKNTQDYFNAELQEVDMLDSETPKMINDWVDEQTNGTIEEIVDDSLSPNTVAMLINAIYFKGDWTHTFEEGLTEDHAFHLEDGSTEDIPLMSLTEKLYYLETDTFQAVALPYGDGEMNMHVFLPKEDTDLASFQEELTSDNWESWQSDFEKTEGTIMLPKFELEYEANLVEPLTALGMEAAFDAEDASFPNMIEEDQQIFISDIKQKTFLDIHEEGTEASAATNVQMEMTSAPIDQNEPFHMEVNRPFFMTITDSETGAILFMGLIKQPS